MQTMTQTGLSSSEAATRIKQYGYNELTVSAQRSLAKILWAEATEPMVLLLLVCSGVYFSFGSLKEAIILLFSVILVIGITLFQERKTERALEALRHLSSPRASVIRDGNPIRIAARDVVPGDLLLLEDGDRIPADAKLLSSSEIHVDESLLTGESVSVSKEPSSMVYASTLIVRGRGMAQVETTGKATEVGKIGRALEIVSSGHSPLRREIQDLVKILAIVAIGFCLLTVVWLGLLRGSWREGLLAGLTLAMSLLPEEFPVVLTVFFALGAYRIARQRVLTRRLPAIEALGSATVLCADKTGTLTENQMRVTHYVVNTEGITHSANPLADAAAQELAAVGALACPPESFDPVDKAAIDFGTGASEDLGRLRKQQPIHEYPLSPERPMIAEAYEREGGLFVALKGAPEAVAKVCRWTPAEMSRLPALLEPLVSQGLRVITVGKARLPAGQPPQNLEDIPFEFLGFLGMTDPLRAGVREAIGECHSAGIQVLMITGDYPKTASVIAHEAGLTGTGIITGDELEASIADEAFRRRLSTTEIFARFKPLHKLRLVQALREMGAVVAMTGDGVNDAPALKAAHIGIAMGGRGTDVAREAADLVVLDDNFVSIVGAIRMGRRIYNNLQKSLSYLLAVHVPIAGMALLPLIFGWPLFFTPVHVVFLELIIDPACSFVFEGEPEEADIMKQPPRPRESRLLNRTAVLQSLVDGLIVLTVTAVVFHIGLTREAGEMDARTMGFATLILGNLILILANRTRSQKFWKAMLTPNRAWLAVAGGALAALAVTLYVPSIRTLFKFSFLHPDDLVVCAAGLVALVVLFYLAHLFIRPRLKPTIE
jgi:P-type Ca2+ transporter type 2C